MYSKSNLLFRHKPLKFTPPEKVDGQFYLDVKNQLAQSPDFKFESEVNFWHMYKFIFLASLLFLCSVVLVTTLFLFNIKVVELPLVFGISFIIIMVGIRPFIYFTILFIHYFKFIRDERKFHTAFKKAVADSSDFEEFSNAFYVGSFAPIPSINEYVLENDIGLLKDFVESKGMSSNIAVYKFSNTPPAFVVLSSNEEINRFIERIDGCKDLKRGDKMRWVVKYQSQIPCLYGNKGLRKYMEHV